MAHSACVEYPLECGNKVILIGVVCQSEISIALFPERGGRLLRDGDKGLIPRSKISGKLKKSPRSLCGMDEGDEGFPRSE